MGATPLFPETITHLILGISFNQPIDNLLPPLLLLLKVGAHFSQPVNSLPTQLTQLGLGSDFNHPIDHLPSSLRYLKLGYGFQHSLLSLPTSLTRLSLRMSATSQPVLL